MSQFLEQCTYGLFQLLSHYNKEGTGIEISQVDSFEFIQIMLGIEEAYDIVFDQEMMTYEVLQDIPALASYILSKQQSM